MKPVPINAGTGQGLDGDFCFLQCQKTDTQVHPDSYAINMCSRE